LLSFLQPPSEHVGKYTFRKGQSACSPPPESSIFSPTLGVLEFPLVDPTASLFVFAYNPPCGVSFPHPSLHPPTETYSRPYLALVQSFLMPLSMLSHPSLLLLVADGYNHTARAPPSLGFKLSRRAPPVFSFRMARPLLRARIRRWTLFPSPLWSSPLRFFSLLTRGSCSPQTCETGNADTAWWGAPIFLPFISPPLLNSYLFFSLPDEEACRSDRKVSLSIWEGAPSRPQSLYLSVSLPW